LARHGKVPAGKRLTFKSDLAGYGDPVGGRDPLHRGALRPVPVPEKITRFHPVVARFRDEDHRHEVSKPFLPRALRLLQALVTEAERRGYEATNVAGRTTSYGRVYWTGSRAGHITIAVSGHACALRLADTAVLRSWIM
jgi:hypothetical protein